MDNMPCNLLRMICHRFDLPLSLFRGSKGPIWISYRCSSFGGLCAYIHYLLQRMLLTCGVWSAYGPLIACASWIERVYVWEAKLLLFLPCFRLLFLSGILGMVARLSGWQQVRAILYACIHPGPSGRCLVRIASLES